ncbi:MAG: hypothetical protein AAF548_19810 [Actinomycetota bacterium]
MLLGVSNNAIRLEPAFTDRDAVRTLVEGAGPYVALARTAKTEDEEAETGRAAVAFVPPWFRRDLVTAGEVRVDGAEVIRDNPAFVDAALGVFPDSTIAEPTTVYVNVMAPTPFPFVAHVDIPVFRHADRWNTPVWLLHAMLRSGLFEDRRVKLATAVAWFYDGDGGAFHYWPDGPDGEAHVEAPPFGNVAVVADNEQVFHGVGSLGDRAKAHPGSLTIDATMEHSGDAWSILDPEPVATHDPADIRITISWKAEVFADDAERDAVRAGGDVPIGMIVDRFRTDLHAKGIAHATPDDPFHDNAWTDLLQATYPSPAPPIPSGA